jgi:hypothetical protein
MSIFRLLSGTHRNSNGETALAGELFTEDAYDYIDDVPMHLRPRVTLVTRPGEEKLAGEEEPKKNSEIFMIQHRGGGKYNVVNKNSGSKINDNLLSRDDAEKLADELNS